MSNLNSFKNLSIDQIDEINKLTEQAQSLIQIVINDGHDLDGFVSSQQIILGTLWVASDLIEQISQQIALAE